MLNKVQHFKCLDALVKMKEMTLRFWYDEKGSLWHFKDICDRKECSLMSVVECDESLMRSYESCYKNVV